MTPVRLLWLRLRLSGMTPRQAERWLHRQGGMSRAEACEFVARHKHELWLRNA